MEISREQSTTTPISNIKLQKILISSLNRVVHIIMNYWPPPLFPSSNDSCNLGGYNNHHQIEHLTIDKATQKELKKLIKTLTDVNGTHTLIPSNGNPHLKNFIIEFLPCSRKLNVNKQPWKEPIWPNKLETLTSNVLSPMLKEKMYVDTLFKASIKEILPPKCNATLQYLECSSFSKEQSFILDIVNVTSRKKQLLPEVNLQLYWGSNLQQKQDCILIETLNDTSEEYSNVVNQFTLEEIPEPNLSRFHLELFSKPVTEKRVHLQYTLPTWNKPDIPSITENHYLLAEQQLFDDTFNDLEFYLQRINRKCSPERLKLHKKSFTRKHLPAWHIDKEVLLSWDWNPFRKIDFEFRAVVQNLEDVLDIEPFRLELNNSNYEFCYSSELYLLQNDMQGTVLHKLPPTTVAKGESVENDNKAEMIANEKETTSMDSSRYENTTTETPINTSLIPHKRSILDSDLLSLIVSKKKNLTQNTTTIIQDHSNNISSSIIHHGLVKCRIDISNDTSIISEEFIPEIKITMDQLNSEDFSDTLPKTIILNSNKLLMNYDVVNHLRGVNYLNVKELKLKVNCDIILNSTSCIIRISLEKFQQVLQNGKLYYADDFKQLSMNFKRVIVLVNFNRETADSDLDIFWRVQLCLSSKQFTIHYIANNSNNTFDSMTTTSYILGYVKALSLHVETQSLLSSERQDYELVQSVTNNPILTAFLLEKFTLFQLLCEMTKYKNKDLQPYLTEYQWSCFHRLLKATW